MKPKDKQHFDNLLNNNQLSLAIIGMSNIGKTLWSNRLTKVGFKHICCDDQIETKLKPELNKKGYSGLEDIAKWMGQPYEERFEDAQEKYLRLEIETMQEILQQLEYQSKQEKNMVIDTTGSLVHTGKDICQKLQNLVLPIYIEATEEMKEEMFNYYLKEPKPVIWEGVFNKKESENNKEALARCYPKLLDLRSERYSKIADITIPYPKTKKIEEAKSFINLVKNQL